MKDIVERLRNWRTVHLARLHLLMDEAADEIERLVANRNHWMGAARAFDEHLATMRVMLMEQPGVRFGSAESRETVQCPYVTGDTTKYCTLTPFTLTAEEREAVAYYLGTGGPYAVHATLSRLLSRTGSDAEKTADDAAECRSHGEKLPERERVANHPATPESSTLTAAEREAVRFCFTAALPETQKLGGVAGELCRLHAATLRGLLERLGDTPAAHATPTEGSKQNGCTLTDEDRHPQNGVVVQLPRLLWDSSEKMGKGEWDYRQRVKTALEVAGVKWAVVEQ